MKKLAFLSLPLLMMACGQETTTEEPKENTIPLVEDTVVTEQVEVETVEAHGWYSFFGVTEADFEVTPDSLLVYEEPMSYQLPEEGMGMFANSMVYSPDSSHCIDLDSYGMDISENEDGTKEYMGTEVDSKVYLLSFNGTEVNTLELMMCGTYCNPLDAEWKSNTLVNLMGTSYNEELNQDFPTVWQYDLTTSTFVMFVADTPIKDGVGNYLEEVRLPLILN